MIVASAVRNPGEPPMLTAPADASVRTNASAAPLDDTAEPADRIEDLALAVSKRTQVLLLRQQSLQQDLQIKLDRMRADFNAAQEERAEQLREMNAVRDMAVEQGKKDDEILKKFITMI